MNSQLSEHISANVPIREGPASMIGSACRSGRTSPAFKKPRGHLLSQSVCVKIQVSVKILRSLIPQFATDDFSDGVLRQDVAEEDAARAFVAGEPGLARVVDLLFGQGGSPPHDEQIHRFAALLVGDANRRALR